MTFDMFGGDIMAISLAEERGLEVALQVKHLLPVGGSPLNLGGHVVSMYHREPLAPTVFEASEMLRTRSSEETFADGFPSSQLQCIEVDIR